jgi:hypothetical protein
MMIVCVFGGKWCFGYVFVEVERCMWRRERKKRADERGELSLKIERQTRRAKVD